MKKNAILLPLICVFVWTDLSATSLKEIAKKTLANSPIMKERLYNYRATREDVSIAEAGYYPTLDLQSSVGRKKTGMLTSDSDVAESTYSVFQNSLVLRQNIFNGFSTHEQVSYQKMRTPAAAYSYLEKANDVTLRTSEVYIDLLEQRDLLRNSDTNVDHVNKIFDKVSKAYKAGLTTLSEVSKVKSSLYLAKSNRLVQENKLANALYHFRRVTGQTIKINELESVPFNHKLPKSLDRASMFALEYNPSILVGDYNIKGAESLYRESKSKYYPKVDLEVSQNYNDNYNEFDGKDDRFQAMLIVSYNIFNGGADEAAVRGKLAKVNQELAVIQDLRRQVMEGMDLSWSAHELAGEQIPFLKKYKEQSTKTLKLYAKEYDMGERSLLDLLATENDLKRANDELIHADYNRLKAKFRIMDAMGLTAATVMGNLIQYYQRVGLYGNGKDYIKDKVAVTNDRDYDGISDSRDLCPDTPSNSKTLPFGCTRSINALDTIRLK